MPKFDTENALSAVNQQGRSRKRNPQRLNARYPTSKNVITDIEATLLGILYTEMVVYQKKVRMLGDFI